MTLKAAETFHNYLNLEGNLAEALEVYNHEIREIKISSNFGPGIFFRDESILLFLRPELCSHRTKNTCNCLVAATPDDFAEQLFELSSLPGWEPLAHTLVPFIQEATKNVKSH